MIVEAEAGVERAKAVVEKEAEIVLINDVDSVEILYPSTMAGGAADFSADESVVGLDEGLAVGESVVGLDEGLAVGKSVVGLDEGLAVGESVVGLDKGLAVGAAVVGLDEGLAVGAAVVGLDEGLAFYAQHNVQCVQSRWQFTLL